MLRRNSVFAAIAALLLIMAESHAQLVEDYRFKGSVVGTDGKPLPGVSVTLRNVESGARIVFTTGTDGSFDQRMIPHAVYEASYEKTGYDTLVEQLNWSASAPEPIVKQVRIVLESTLDRTRRESGAKAGKLYEASYNALTAGDCATASATARELLALGSGSTEYAVRFILGRCLAMRDSIPAAIDEYRRVIVLRPDLFEAHFDLASLLEKMSDHAGALAEFKQAGQLRPEDAEVEYNMGAILFQAQDWDPARTHLERATQLAPDHALAHKALGFVALQSKDKDLQAAALHLARYVELAPNAKDAVQIREIVAALATTNPAATTTPVHK